MITATLSRVTMKEKDLPSRGVIVDEIVHETAKAILAKVRPRADAADECHRCGRPISNPVSRMIGYGPDCVEIMGFTVPSVEEAEVWASAMQDVFNDRVYETWIPKARLEGYVSKEKPTVVTRGVGKYHDPALMIASDIIHKEKCKALPQARWNADEKVWEVPDRESVILDIIANFEGIPLQMPDIEIPDTGAETEEVEPADIPLTKTEPWTHQRKAYAFAKDKPGVMLAMGMGTGKSKTSIDIISNSEAKRVLILAPRFVVRGWAEQFDLHSPLDWTVLALDHGGVKDKAELLMQVMESEPERLVVVMNYEATWRPPIGPWVDHQGENKSLFKFKGKELNTAKQYGAKVYSGILGTVDWDVVVCDESHRIKNHDSKQGRMAAFLGEHAKKRLALTGTPMGNPLDVFGQYKFLDPAIFGDNWWSFRNHYGVMGGYEGRQVVGVRNQEELNRKFYSIAFRVKEEDVLDLPEIVHITRKFDMGQKAQGIYASLYEDMEAALEEGTLTPANAAVRMLRLQQVSSGFARLDESGEPIKEKDEDKRGRTVRVDEGKEQVLKEFLEDLDPKEPVVVFGWFHEDLNIVHKVADELGRGSGEMSGRRDEREPWKAGEFPILAVQIQAGAEGVNDLVYARYAVYFSTGRSLVKYQQSVKRIHRPGQKRNVTILHLMARGFYGTDSFTGEDRYYGSADERAYEDLNNKRDLVKGVMDMVRRKK